MTSAATSNPETVRSLRRQFRAVLQMSLLTTRSLDTEPLLQRTLGLIIRATRTDSGSILLRDEDGRSLVFRVVTGKKSKQLTGTKIKMGEGIAGWTAMKGKPILANDVSKDRRFSPKISLALNYRTYNILCVPLKAKGKVIGVVEVINKKDRKSFIQEDLELLQGLAAQAAIVVENALVIQNLGNQLKLLHMLQDSAKLINSTLQLKELLQIILQTTASIMNAEASSLFLIDASTGVLVADVATGPKEADIKKIRVPIGAGIVGWVAQQNQPLLIPDAQQDPRFFKKADEQTKFVTRNIVAVPLRSKGQVIGVVEVLNKKGDQTFSQDDEDLLMAVADQAAVAVENARLYQDVQELFVETVTSLARAIETKDVYTRGHSERVRAFSMAIADSLGLVPAEREEIQLSALLHDIGKIGVDEAILNKPSSLTPEERREVEKHPLLGAEIVRPVKKLQNVMANIKHHHERWDGKGYPDGLKGDAIPSASRILAVADSFDAMTSDRPYRQAMSGPAARDIIAQSSGTQFEPRSAAAFLKAYDSLRIADFMQKITS